MVATLVVEITIKKSQQSKFITLQKAKLRIERRLKNNLWVNHFVLAPWPFHRMCNLQFIAIVMNKCDKKFIPTTCGGKPMLAYFNSIFVEEILNDHIDMTP